MARIGPPPPAPVLERSNVRVAALVAGFHEGLATQLLDGTRGRLTECGLPGGALAEFWVPGAFELPLACQVAAATDDYAALIVLGVVIRGQTPNFDYICQAAINGIASVGLAFSIPIGFGLLTVDNVAQAEARAGGDVGNSGVDAADAAVKMLNLGGQLQR